MAVTVAVVLLVAILALIVAVIFLAVTLSHVARDAREQALTVIQSAQLERETLFRYAFSDAPFEVGQLLHAEAAADTAGGPPVSRLPLWPVDAETREDQVPVGMG